MLSFGYVRRRSRESSPSPPPPVPGHGAHVPLFKCGLWCFNGRDEDLLGEVRRPVFQVGPVVGARSDARLVAFEALTLEALVNCGEIAVHVIDVVVGRHVALAELRRPVEGVRNRGVADGSEFLVPEFPPCRRDLVQQENGGLFGRLTQELDLVADSVGAPLRRGCSLYM